MNRAKAMSVSRTIQPTVPKGVDVLLEGLTREVLKEQPRDIYLFAAEHLQELIRLRDLTAGGGTQMSPSSTQDSENLVSEDSALDLKERLLSEDDDVAVPAPVTADLKSNGDARVISANGSAKPGVVAAGVGGLLAAGAAAAAVEVGEHVQQTREDIQKEVEEFVEEVVVEAEKKVEEITSPTPDSSKSPDPRTPTPGAEDMRSPDISKSPVETEANQEISSPTPDSAKSPDTKEPSPELEVEKSPEVESSPTERGETPANQEPSSTTPDSSETPDVREPSPEVEALKSPDSSKSPVGTEASPVIQESPAPTPEVSKSPAPTPEVSKSPDDREEVSPVAEESTDMETPTFPDTLDKDIDIPKLSGEISHNGSSRPTSVAEADNTLEAERKSEASVTDDLPAPVDEIMTAIEDIQDAPSVSPGAPSPDPEDGHARSKRSADVDDGTTSVASSRPQSGYQPEPAADRAGGDSGETPSELSTEAEKVVSPVESPPTPARSEVVCSVTSPSPTQSEANGSSRPQSIADDMEANTGGEVPGSASEMRGKEDGETEVEEKKQEDNKDVFEEEKETQPLEEPEADFPPPFEEETEEEKAPTAQPPISTNDLPPAVTPSQSESEDQRDDQSTTRVDSESGGTETTPKMTLDGDDLSILSESTVDSVAAVRGSNYDAASRISMTDEDDAQLPAPLHCQDFQYGDPVDDDLPPPPDECDMTSPLADVPTPRSPETGEAPMSGDEPTEAPLPQPPADLVSGEDDLPPEEGVFLTDEALAELQKPQECDELAEHRGYTALSAENPAEPLATESDAVLLPQDLENLGESRGESTTPLGRRVSVGGEDVSDGNDGRGSENEGVEVSATHSDSPGGSGEGEILTAEELAALQKPQECDELAVHRGGSALSGSGSVENGAPPAGEELKDIVNGVEDHVNGESDGEKKSVDVEGGEGLKQSSTNEASSGEVDDSSLSSAATKIQAGTRGYLTRKHMKDTISSTVPSLVDDSQQSTGTAHSSEEDENGVQTSGSMETEVQRHSVEDVENGGIISVVISSSSEKSKENLENHVESDVESGQTLDSQVTKSERSSAKSLRNAEDQAIWQTLQDEMEEAATKIQSNYRGFSTRQKLHRENAVQKTSSSNGTPSASVESEIVAPVTSMRSSGEFHDLIVLPMTAVANGETKEIAS